MQVSPFNGLPEQNRAAFGISSLCGKFCLPTTNNRSHEIQQVALRINVTFGTLDDQMEKLGGRTSPSLISEWVESMNSMEGMPTDQLCCGLTIAAGERLLPWLLPNGHATQHALGLVGLMIIPSNQPQLQAEMFVPVFVRELHKWWWVALKKSTNHQPPTTSTNRLVNWWLCGKNPAASWIWDQNCQISLSHGIWGWLLVILVGNGW